METPPVYKYHLEKQLLTLPRSISIQDILRELKKVGISRDAFYRDRNILKGQEKDMPAERLLIYSRFFGITMNDLFNYDVKVAPIFNSGYHLGKLKTGLSMP